MELEEHIPIVHRMFAECRNVGVSERPRTLEGQSKFDKKMCCQLQSL
jgi:hypothetical protein